MFEIVPELQKIYRSEDGAQSEAEQLRRSIQKEGIREPVIVWRSRGWLLDGHTRVAIASELGIEGVPTRGVEIETHEWLDDVANAELWIRENQTQRRNLGDKAWADDQGRRYHLRKQPHGAPTGNPNAAKNKCAESAHLNSEATREQMAEEDGVSPRTIAANAAYNKDLDTICGALRLERRDVRETLTKGDAKKLAKLTSEDEVLATAAWKRLRQGTKNIAKALSDIATEIAAAKAAVLREQRRERIESIECSDAVSFLRGLADVDCFVFDPPYGLETHRTREGGKDYADGEDYAKQLLGDVALAIRKCAKPGAHVYCFSGYSFVHEFKRILGTHLEVQDNPLIWVKDNHTMRNFKTGYANKHEYILFAKVPGGSRDLNERCSPDVLQYSRSNRSTHSAEKPVALLEYLIGNSTMPGDLVVDCFMGSGSTGIAAVEAGRRFAGCDIDQMWADYATTMIVEACNGQ